MQIARGKMGERGKEKKTISIAVFDVGGAVGGMSRNIRVTVNIVYFQDFVIFPSLASTHDGAPLPDARGGRGLVGAAEFGRVEGSPGAERGRREERRGEKEWPRWGGAADRGPSEGNMHLWASDGTHEERCQGKAAVPR